LTKIYINDIIIISNKRRVIMNKKRRILKTNVKKFMKNGNFGYKGRNRKRKNVKIVKKFKEIVSNMFTGQPVVIKNKSRQIKIG